VVGGGPAGMTAALGASHQGAKVAMIEKDAVTRGTAVKGAGGVWILNNRFMREQGADDPRDDALRLMARLSRPALYDPQGETLGLPAREYALIETYYDRGAAVLESLEEMGLRMTQQSPIGDPVPDYHAGFVIVTPEYNHGTSGVLKNAIDYLFAEWANKAVGFVSYGGVGGARATEHLRLIAGELQMADVRQQVALSLMTEFENFSVFKPGEYNLAALHTMLDQVVAWSAALAPLRMSAAAAG
jgi:hypothetical protein